MAQSLGEPVGMKAPLVQRSPTAVPSRSCGAHRKGKEVHCSLLNSGIVLAARAHKISFLVRQAATRLCQVVLRLKALLLRDSLWLFTRSAIICIGRWIDGTQKHESKAGTRKLDSKTLLVIQKY